MLPEKSIFTILTLSFLLVVSAFLDMAELRAERKLPTTMEPWIEFMGGFLKLNDYPILQGLGKISLSLSIYFYVFYSILFHI
jgi:hypothetical protein